MEQTRAPLWEKITEFKQKKGRVWLHVPTHGGGRGLPPLMGPIFSAYAQLDLTELPGLDDLFHATGVLAEAQDLTARLWQARRSYFLVNGASAGVRAMVLATCNPGDTILIARNAHGSLAQALVSVGVIPRYLPVAEVEGFPLNVTVEAVKEGLRRYPQAKALLLTSPSYFGVTANLAAIAEVVHQTQALLLVDEAHGGHFEFSDQLPTAAGQHCDLRVQSWHKTLGALTPGAVLHWHRGAVDEDRLQTALQGVQTSSPPYPLLVSLDLVRQRMALEGKELVGQLIEQALALRLAVGKHFPLLTPSLVQSLGFELDITRVTILTAQAGVCGLAVGQQLAQQGIDLELIQPDCVLAIVGPGYREQWTARLAKSLAGMQLTSANLQLPALPPVPELVMTPREAAYRQHVTIPYQAAAERVAAAMVVCYPPGIPLCLPGERITSALITYLTGALELGVNFRGLTKDGQLKVVKEVT
ncbi:MAG TPA: aminotransferase class I/II-fold pyridoxal phosphate-dependent enzyme [Oscillospiraceae bacterium]|nr:aminotransferase class I/II-fold pyridoxal phosphate-dependent enzyme [Oscillospiraceae bacterium]